MTSPENTLLSNIIQTEQIVLRSAYVCIYIYKYVHTHTWFGGKKGEGGCKKLCNIIISKRKENKSLRSCATEDSEEGNTDHFIRCELV